MDIQNLLAAGEVDLRSRGLDDTHAVQLFRALRDAQDVSRVLLEGNAIGVAGLRALSLHGHRVVPGRQKSLDPVGSPSLIREQFRRIDGDSLFELWGDWLGLLVDGLEGLATATGTSVGNLGTTIQRARPIDVATQRVIDQLDAIDSRVLRPLLDSVAKALRDLLAAHGGDFGNDFGIGWRELAAAVCDVSGTLQTAHRRGPIAIRRDQALLDQLCQSVDRLASDGRVHRVRAPMGPMPEPLCPTGLDDLAVVAACIASGLDADATLAALLLADMGDAATMERLLSEVRIDDGVITAPHLSLAVELLRVAPSDSTEAVRIRKQGTTIQLTGDAVDVSVCARLENLLTLIVVTGGKPVSGLFALRDHPGLQLVLTDAHTEDLSWVPRGAWWVQANPTSLRGIDACTNLRVLRVRQVRHTEALAGMPLRYLEIATSDPTPLYSLSTLEGLTLTGTPTMDGLSRLSDLETLTLVGPKRIAGLSLPKLVYLQLGRPTVDASGTSLPSLRFLQASACELDAVDMPATLEELSCGYRGAESALRPGPALTWLDLRGATLLDGLAAFHGHPRLQTVGLYRCTLTDTSHLASLPALQTLVLCCGVPWGHKYDLTAFTDHPVTFIHVDKDNADRRRMKKKLKEKLHVNEHDLPVEPPGTAWNGRWLQELAERTAEELDAK